MHLGVPFIAPRDLGAVGAPFGRLWLPFIRGCIELSDAQQIVNSAGWARAENPLIGCFPILGAPNRLLWGTELSGAPLDR
jgi:hypothetical protein